MQMDRRKKKELPCPVGGCTFQGLKLKRHLMSKYHCLQERGWPQRVFREQQNQTSVQNMEAHPNQTVNI